MTSLPVVTLVSRQHIVETGMLPQAGYAPDFYIDRLKNLQSKYMEYPRNVAIGLQARCNAACNFCPYPSMTNKGETMPTETVYRLLDEIADWPEINPFTIKFQHVSEPLLDNRIFQFMKYVDQRIPWATIPMVSNGSVLTDKNIARLSNITCFRNMAISFNDHRRDEYERVMQLPYDRTLANLNRLHGFLEKHPGRFNITLSRVGDGTKADDEFKNWCDQNYPLFTNNCIPRADWLGAVQTQVYPAWDAGCGQWFRLRILQNGKSAFCCMDSDGSFGTGSIEEMTLYEIYNLPESRKRREELPSRLALEGCMNCPLLN